MSYLEGRDARDHERRVAWARIIARGGLHMFTMGAFLPLADLERASAELGQPCTLTTAEQKRRRAFLAELRRKRVIRQWMILATDDVLIAVEHASGAPFFLAGTHWDAFADELDLVAL